MEIKREDLKQYIIENGVKEKAGIGKNAVEVYVCKGIVMADFYIVSDGSRCWYRDGYTTFFRYNTRRDKVQACHRRYSCYS